MAVEVPTTFMGLTDTPKFKPVVTQMVQEHPVADGLELTTSFGIDTLSDVDTTSTPPTSGQVLKWSGTNGNRG